MGNTGGGAASPNTSIAGVACLSLFTHATSCGSSLRSSNQIQTLTKKILQKIPIIQAYFKLYNFFLNFFPYFFKQFRKSSRIACEKRRQWKNDAIAMPGLPTLAHTHTRTPRHRHTPTHRHTRSSA